MDLHRCNEQHSQQKVCSINSCIKSFANIVCRKKISERVAREPGLSVIFLESVCEDKDIIDANVALKVSSGDPDYAHMSRDDAKRDFLRRIDQYLKVYETITDEAEPRLSYLKITDVGREVSVSHIHGYLQSRIAFYLMNLHIKPRSIFFSRVKMLFLVEVYLIATLLA